MSKLLIVDDEAPLAGALADYLEGKGHEVFVCTDPFAAEDEVAARRPDLAIFDYMMPGRRGTEILAALRAKDETRRLPVIFLSGTETLRFSGEVPPEPRVRFLRKPVELQSMLVLIGEMLNPDGWTAA